MKAHSLEIRSLEADDIERIVEIHCERFPLSRTTQLGKPFLRRMYRWFLAHARQLSFVALKDGRVEGFVVGSWGGYGQGVFRFALPQLLWGVLCKPRLLLNGRTYALCQTCLRGLLPSKVHRKPSSNSGLPAAKGVTLGSIAMSRSYRGVGGLYLFLKVEKAASEQGAAYMSGTVETANTEVVRMVKSLGWEVVTEDEEHIALRKDLGHVMQAK